MRHLEIEVTNADELLATEAYGAGALLRWERSSTEAGTYVEGGTEALVAGTTLYDVWDAAGIETTWYRTRISNAGGTTFSAYSSPRSPVTSVTSVAQVRALVSTSMSDADLQGVIDREEAALARQVTALAGDRTQTWFVGDQSAMGLYRDSLTTLPFSGRGPFMGAWMTVDRMGPLSLLRPTDAVVVTDNGVTVADDDIRLLRGGTQVERASGGWQGPIVTVAYTPNDALEVARVVIELCRLTLTETGYQSERIGEYQYDRGAKPAGADPRRALVRSLMPHPAKGSMRIRTSSEDDRIGAVTP
jgi:hypothetical protein